MMKKYYLIAGLISAIVPLSGNASSKHGDASSHAPISVMGDHLHAQGEWMLSYRYMQMDMQGSLIGSKRLTARDIVGTGANPGMYMVAPTEMPMEMHMLGSMYGLTDSITLMAMLNFVSSEMTHLTRAGGSFVTESSGLGDTKIGALISLIEKGHHSVHANINVSLPTGSIDERDDTPVMQNAFLPYPMQLGSGTVDFNPGVTYRGYATPHTWSWGAQASAVIRTGTNDEGYTLGDRFEVTTWLARDISTNFSLSLSLKYQDWDKIDGQNDALNPMMIQTADTSLQGGDRMDLSIGANYIFNNGHRLAIEYAKPIAQDLNGPQLKTESILTVGWQKAF